MAFIQKNVPPPSKSYNFAIKDFSGGLNNRSHQLNLNESPDMKNLCFSDETLLERRKGVEHYDEQTLNGSVLYIDEYKPYSDSNKFIRATSTSLYVDTASVASVDGPVSGANYMGMYVFADGELIRFYGKFPQASSTYVSVLGTPVNTYQLFDLVNPPGGYMPLGTEHTRGKMVYDYDFNRCWYEPCTNEMNDTFKGANVIPANPKHVVVHGTRLFVSGTSTENDTVFISDLSNGFYFPVYLPIGLPPNSDKISGLCVFYDSVIVGREQDIHVIFGNTNRTDLSSDVFRLRRINTHTGFASNNCINIAHNSLFFLGGDGNFYSMYTPKTESDNLATTSINDQIDLFKSPISVSRDDLQDAYSAFFNDEWHVAIGDKLLVYSYRRRSWLMHKFTSLNVTSVYAMLDKVIYGTNLSRIVKHSDSYTDLGKPYASRWKSMPMDMGDASTFKQFREFFIIVHTFDSFTSDVRFNFDIDYAEVTETTSTSTQIPVWGKATFGLRFIKRNIVSSFPIVIGRRGRIIQINFMNSYDLNFTVDTLVERDSMTSLTNDTVVYVTDENKYYLFNSGSWDILALEDYNQPLKIYEINGLYEFRGKR